MTPTDELFEHSSPCLSCGGRAIPSRGWRPGTLMRPNPYLMVCVKCGFVSAHPTLEKMPRETADAVHGFVVYATATERAKDPRLSHLLLTTLLGYSTLFRPPKEGYDY